MENQYGIGTALLFYRQKKKLTGEIVSKGICSVATLSRIESGIREYHSFFIRAIMERVGIEVNQFEILLNDEDYRISRLRRKMEQLLQAEHETEPQRLKELRQYWEEYGDSNININETVIDRQYLLYVKAKLSLWEHAPIQETISLFETALALTKELDSRKWKGQCFHQLEGRIIYELYQLGRFGEAEAEILFECIEKIWSDQLKDQFLIAFYWRRIVRLEEKGEYEAMLMLAKKVSGLIRQSRSYRFLADVLFGKLRAEVVILKQNGRMEMRREALLEEAMDIYYLYDLEDRDDDRKKITHFCKEEFSWQITT
ncbi:MAG: hypothetical protein SPL15_03125 [Lachnospiraceae bacterium]|nr:hypothetical protein [Lachnospiraceae bacterium]MDY5741977.1 hypothetical protein [Lachnospiraceae bacterium]